MTLTPSGEMTPDGAALPFLQESPMLFFDNKDLTNVLLTARMQGGQLHLAKDEGVYLMPATGAW